MKKRFSMVALALMVLSALVLTACGGGSKDYSESKYVGTWRMAKMEALDESEAFDDEWEITLNADGTGQSITEDGTDDFTWEPTDNGFKTSGALKVTFTDDGDTIRTNVIGVDLVFERK